MKKQTSNFKEMYIFSLNGKTINFIPFVEMEVLAKGKKESISEIDKYNVLASTLININKKNLSIINRKLKYLEAKLFLDIREDITKGGERATEKLIDSHICYNEEYKKLYKMKDEIQLKIDVLYSIVYQAKDRRDDIKFVNGYRKEED